MNLKLEDFGDNNVPVLLGARLVGFPSPESSTENRVSNKVGHF